MYASSASLSAAWGTLLARVSAASRVDLEVIEHAYPAPLDDLWARDDMGCVFMCGYPWALRSSRPRLLAVPVPSPPRYGGRPVYFTDFVVRADSRFRILEDTFGARLAYSIESSHSGYNAPRHHLLAYRTAVRVIATTEAAPMPPLVASPMIDADMCARLKVALLDAHRDPGLVSTLESLLLTRFLEATPSRYEVFLERQRAAESAGYTVLA
jgi:ABC-type phosphate/phosphonate transport system substrate-binding protein